MYCRDIKELMVDYLDGQLSHKLKEEVEKHLANCESCLDEVNQLKNLFGDIYEVEDAIPDNSLKENFYTMLEREKHKSQKDKLYDQYKESKSVRKLWTGSPLMQLAAGFALLIAGIFIGLNLSRHPATSDVANSELTALKNEMMAMKQMVMFSMLQRESASERIKAVSYADEFIEPNTKIIQALVRTLNNDKNANVRLAAANALFQFADSKAVRDSMIEALGSQTDPLIQITLINMMVELEEVRSVDYMKRIINNTETLEEVKHEAEKGLVVLL